MNYTITIEIEPNGNFTYGPAVLRVCPGDTVQWICPMGDFAVMFQSSSPFEKGMEGYAPLGYTSSPMVVAQHSKGQFKYAVSVHMGGRVYMDCSCPVLVAN